MTHRAGRIALSVLLIGGFCVGCGDPGSVSNPGSASSTNGFATAYKLSAPPSGTPPLQDALHGTEAMLADLAGGRCPTLPAVQAAEIYLGSSLDRLKAIKMILCRYRGRGDTPPLGLRGSATITNLATVESWRQRFNALPVVDPSKFHCPNDDASAVLAGFPGKDGTVALVQVSLQGCQFVTIGTVTRSTKGSASLRDDILRLVP